MESITRIQLLLRLPLTLTGKTPKEAFNCIFDAMGLDQEFTLHSTIDINCNLHWVESSFTDFVLIQDSSGNYQELSFAMAAINFEYDYKNYYSWFEIPVVEGRISISELLDKYQLLQRKINIK